MSPQMLKVGDVVRFAEGYSHPISNFEIDLSGMSGIVVQAGSKYVAVCLSSIKHLDTLEEWGNCVEWTDDDGWLSTGKLLDYLQIEG